MKKTLLVFLLFPVFAYAQRLDTLTQNTFNRYVLLINDITTQSEDLLTSLKTCYDNVESYQEKKATQIPAFHFIIKPDEKLAEFFQQKDTSGKINRERQIFLKMMTLWEIIENVNKNAVFLENYIEHQEFANDGLKGFQHTIQEFEKLFADFSRQSAACNQLILKAYRLYQPYNAGHPFHREENLMLQILEKEKQALDLWKYDFNDHIHTGWAVSDLEKNSKETTDLLKKLKENNAKLPQNNQAGGIYGSFIDLAEAIQHTKNNALVDYNDEARLNDEHSNQTYLNLLHQVNHDLTENFNSFVVYRRQFGDRFIYAFKYMPLFEVKTDENLSDLQTHKFKDITIPEIKVTPQNAIPPKPMTELFNEYVEYINESIVFCQSLHEQLSNYASQISLAKIPAGKKQNINPVYADTENKVSAGLYNRVYSDNTNLPESYRRPLIQQVEVLRNILSEMGNLSKELALYVKNKKYNMDSFKRSDEILSRYVVLFQLFDTKKERLYGDIHKIYASYQASVQSDSWIVSSKALAEVLESDKQLLRNIKSYQKGSTANVQIPGNLEGKTMKLLINEETNLHNITRLGIDNPLCPYNMYEDIANTSRMMIDNARNLPGAPLAYDKFLLLYNTAIEKYNRFSKVAPVSILKNVSQMKTFELTKHADTKPYNTNK